MLGQNIMPVRTAISHWKANILTCHSFSSLLNPGLIFRLPIVSQYLG